MKTPRQRLDNLVDFLFEETLAASDEEILKGVDLEELRRSAEADLSAANKRLAAYRANRR